MPSEQWGKGLPEMGNGLETIPGDRRADFIGCLSKSI
jgi:hypothetical protein